MARPSHRAGKAAAKKSPSLPVLLLCLLPLIALLWLLVRLESGADKTQQADSAKQKPPAAHSEARRPPVKPPTPNYEFYETLPKGQASRPPAATQQPKAPAKPAPRLPKTEKIESARANAALHGEVPPARIQYFLQAGSFKKAEEAEQLRAELALLGQMTRLEQSRQGRQTWHRVMVGPFASQQQLAQTRKQLSAQGFNQLLSQQRKAP